MKEALLKYMAKFTSLSAEEQQAIVDEIQIEKYGRGTVLLRQGDTPTRCYFVLKGCVRQYSVDESGRERTSNFYTEEQAIGMFNRHRSDKSSEYAFACLEDSVLVVGELSAEADMYHKYTELEAMTRRMIEESFGQVQDEFASFMASTPEERFKALLRNRPQLIDRVPQHQLASYLGITAESLSRIKKRTRQGNA
ncbi:Crp/Fnr family transcriptional regulator [Paenibacillus arenilitoris]|uniref:Crp/Fnr family transcriptional regulator n=1 Tax=Paenibacillus arenilitoris TaxID=2772299 RepID=A0A927H878_9BACL|nr:Crp/Fnr family transcriptional regulator [Paenibacillus arenilitoris]MBD2870349.1 Crp/Fnr family transcriptional regulator [Paenibacillus arenilitoris]